MTALPRELRPMLATSGRLPADDDRWAYEVKWDGVRLLAFVDAGQLRLVSRNGNDVSGGYPELQGLSQVVDGVLLDGELVALTPQGRPDFGLLQARMHVRGPSKQLVSATPVTFMAFDVLHHDGRSLLELPYDDRRATLDSLGLAGAAWQVPPAFVGDGTAVSRATLAQGLEGVVAKLRTSRYEQGRRSDSWVKHKHQTRTSAVIVGWQPGAGSRAGGLGSLLLAVNGPACLIFAGHVGTGFSDATLRQLADRLAPLRRDTAPLDDVPRGQARTAVWVEPLLVCEVEHTEWTREGRLRHPSFKGLRDDVDPRAVVHE